MVLRDSLAELDGVPQVWQFEQPSPQPDAALDLRPSHCASPVSRTRVSASASLSPSTPRKRFGAHFQPA